MLLSPDGGMASGAVTKCLRTKALRVSSVLLALLVALTFSACYEIPQEIIPATLGEIIPDAPDQADLDGGGKIIFSRAAANNDYLFRDVSYSGSERQGSLRAMRIKDSIYAVQARYDDESHYQIFFYSINSAQIRPTDVAKSTDLKIFASLYGVEFKGDDFTKGFSGKPGKILAMLRGMSEVDFEP